jgi:uncharacterized protein (TIGR03437 family)
MSNALRGLVLALASLVLHGQQLPFPTYLNPSVLLVGGPTSLSVFNQDYHAGLTALWNGSPRPTSRNDFGSYIVTLTDSDLAVPQLAQLTMMDSASGAVVDVVNCAVGYNVQPTGVAFDRSRNRLYIATPTQAGDPQFPVNSVVAVDLASAKVGPVLQIGSALGDLALSDDGSALYVVVEGANAVRRIDPATLTAAGDFSFRTGAINTFPGGVPADTIAVMPGKPGTVLLEFSPQVGLSTIQVAIFDDGVKRPNVSNGLCCGFSAILFSPDGKYLFQNGRTDYGLATFRYSLDSTGIPAQTPAYAAGAAPAAILGGTLYTNAATTIDYQSMQLTGNFGVGGPIAVDAANQRAYVLYTPPALNDSGFGPPPELVAFALPGLQPLGTLAIGTTAINLNAPETLIRFGADGFVIPSMGGLLIFHTPLAGPAPAAAANAVVQGASQQAGPISPGEILTLYGTNLGPSTPQTAVSTAAKFPSSLAGVQVLFGRLPGTPLMVYQGQINVVAPIELQPGTQVDLQVLYYGIPSAKISLPVVAAAPALFTRDGSGTGQVAVVNQDGSINTPSPAGTIVTLFGTGGGPAANAVDGAVPRRADNLLAPVRVTVAGRDAPVLYSGAAPGLVTGVFQLNVRLPGDAPSGSAAITVNIAGQDSSKGATLEIR